MSQHSDRSSSTFEDEEPAAKRMKMSSDDETTDDETELLGTNLSHEGDSSEDGYGRSESDGDDSSQDQSLEDDSGEDEPDEDGLGEDGSSEDESDEDESDDDDLNEVEPPNLLKQILLMHDGECIGFVPYDAFYEVVRNPGGSFKVGKRHRLKNDRDIAIIGVWTYPCNVKPEQATKSFVVFLAKWIHNQNAAAALKAAMPYDKFEFDDEDYYPWLPPFVTMFSTLRSHSNELHADVVDAMVDYFIDQLRESGVRDSRCLLNDIQSCLFFNLHDPIMASIFVNYALYHNQGSFDHDNFLDDSLDHREVVEKLLGLYNQAFVAKDWSILPQDILAEDFQDYCRYHTHGSGQCYRNKSG